MILALAGRRIDAPDSKQRRFPLDNVELVRERIRSLLIKNKPQVLVSSAANGADLLALEIAGDLAIAREVLLPFPPRIFRVTSVADRPGDWGDRFDRVLATLRSQEHLLCLDYPTRTEAAYIATNRAILKHAKLVALREHDSTEALIIWNGESLGARDKTFDFKRAAEELGVVVREVCTL